MYTALLTALAVQLGGFWFDGTAMPASEQVPAVGPAARLDGSEFFRWFAVLAESSQDRGEFQQTDTITVAAKNGGILGFITDGQGGLIALSGVSTRYGASRGPRRGETIPNRLVWMDGSGNERQAVELEEAPLGLNRAADGTVYVVVGTKVFWYAANGGLLGQSEAPHFSLPEEDYEAFTEEAVERRDLSVGHQEARLQQLEQTLKAIEEKPEEDRAPHETYQLDNLARQIKYQKQSIERRQAMTPDQLFAEAVSNAKQLYRVAVSKDHVFLVGRETFGYGYAVWRCDRACQNPVKIVTGLSGCCGQMDLQVLGDHLVVAENSRHRVVLTDFEGETVCRFGSRERSGVGAGFSGCCNPMNTCSTPDGGLLTSESNGCIKRFKADGTFEKVIGTAGVQAGCKNSSVGMAVDGSRIYYLDIDKGQIIVLEKPGNALTQRG